MVGAMAIEVIVVELGKNCPHARIVRRAAAARAKPRENENRRTPVSYHGSSRCVSHWDRPLRGEPAQGVTVSVLVLVVASPVAEMVTLVEVVTGCVVMEKLAEVLPAAILMLLGTLATEGLLLCKATLTPWLQAAAEI